jgi:hypothetical protein
MDDHETILRFKDRADYYAQRMQSGDMLREDELECIRKDLDAMPHSVRAEMEAGPRAAPEHRPDEAGGFTLTEDDIADILNDAPAVDQRPDFTPKL